MPGGVAPKFGSEKVSRYAGVSQLQLRVSRYTVQLSVEETLLRVVDSSKIGRRLFGFAIQSVMATAIARTCDESVATLLSKKVTETRALQIKRDLMTKLHEQSM